MRFYITLFMAVFSGMCQAHAGKKLKVLFIGNSYTYVNDMPQMVADIAAAMGDTVVWDMEAPGGALFLDHYLGNPATIAKIQAGGWDYVVLQEQSLVPAMPEGVVDNFFIYAKKLDSLVNRYNPCAETLFYMTWGRKNGHPYYCNVYSNPQVYNWPHFCTYAAMDSVIRIRYLMAADSNLAVLSPVGAVWHYIRDNYPSVELYAPDESHPSPEGSYAAACCFYTALFKRNPSLIPYNASINSTDAANVRTAVEKVVYDSLLYWHIDQYRTEARFTHTVNAATATFSGVAANATGYTWDFGDGQTATTLNAVHTYSIPGNYWVKLVAVNSNTGCADTAYASLDISTTGIQAKNDEGMSFVLSPNPAHDVIHIGSKAFLAGNYRISLLNELGQTVLVQQSIPVQQQSIDLSRLAGGIYFLSVTKAGHTVYRWKVVKR
jgi:hypothetical protein